MPTSTFAVAAVAAALSGVDPLDREAVTMFYRRRFVDYPLPIRALISDFLIGLTDVPSEEALRRLQQAVALPAHDVPPIEAPDWDERYGPEMTYVPLEATRQAAG